MRRFPLRCLLLACVTTLVLCAPVVALDAAIDYHAFDAVRKQLEAWSGAHPEAFEIETIGRSAAGLPILVARVAAPGGSVDPDRRPAVFVGANMAGYHNAGTEAALHLIQTLLGEPENQLLLDYTFFVAPVLNPDAHDGMFRNPRQRLTGNGASWSSGTWGNSYAFDRDLDGLSQEDGPNDLNGDGLITTMRILDPEGGMLPDPGDARVMIPADPLEGKVGLYTVRAEGVDDDGDGAFNEDGVGGIVPDRNFAHAFEYDDPEAGPWASFAPESQAIMDFLLAHRNVAVAVVYGPANNLLAAPKGFGGGGDTGSLKIKVPERMARFAGLDPEQEYTADEIWEVAKDLSFVVQNNITKEQLIQFLGAGPATKPDDADLGFLSKIADEYKERLEDAGLDNKRAGAQYGKGGFTPWLYYQYGVLALELDVWGVPAAPKEESTDEARSLTLDALAEMSADEFLAFGEDAVAAFLEEIGAPPQFTAAALIQRVEAGEITPARLAEMAKRMGAAESTTKEDGPNDLMVWLDEHAPEAVVPWTEVTLPDGSVAEVGGIDPFIEVAPPYEVLAPALQVHTDTVLDLASKLARIEIVKLEATALGAGVYRVEEVVGNQGSLPTHTKMGQRTRALLPIRLGISLSKGAELVTGHTLVSEERLDGQGGTMRAEWMVRVFGSSAEVLVEAHSDNAGHDQKTLNLEGGS